MEVPHEAKRSVARYPVKGKLVMPADILQQERVRSPTDRGEVQFHLNAPYTCEILRINHPLRPFTVTFQEIAAARDCDNVPQREGRHVHLPFIPPDLRRGPVAKRPAHNPYLHSIEPDIPEQKIAGHRFHGNHMPRVPGSPYGKCTDVCPDIDHDIVLPYIIIVVFRNTCNLAVPGRKPQELHLIFGHEIRTPVPRLAVHLHMNPKEPAQWMYGLVPAHYPAWMLYKRNAGWLVRMFSKNRQAPKKKTQIPTSIIAVCDSVVYKEWGSMDTQYLTSGESIILTLQDIIVSGVRTDVVLTSTRMILVDAGKDQVIHQSIPFETIGSILTGDNAFREPTITLTLTAPSGETKTVELIFFKKPGIEKRYERDRLVAKLKEHSSPSLVHASPTAQSPSWDAAREETGARPNTGSSDLQGAQPATRPPAQEWSPTFSADNSRSPPPPDPSGRLKFNAITVIIIILVAVIAGALIYSQFVKAKPSGNAGPAVNQSPETHTVTANTAAATMTIQQTTAPEVPPTPSSPPQMLVPTSGVWVRVQYPGNFTGTVGSMRGGLMDVNTTGEQYYQVLARDGIVDVSLQKQEGSRDELAVEIYRDGSLLTRSNTTAPRGTVDLHVSI